MGPEEHIRLLITGIARLSSESVASGLANYNFARTQSRKGTNRGIIIEMNLDSWFVLLPMISLPPLTL